MTHSPLNRDWVALEKVRYEDLVLLMVVAGREDVSTLEGLVEVAEDIVDDKYPLLGVVRASRVYGAGE